MNRFLLILLTLMIGPVKFMDANCQTPEETSKSQKTEVATFAGGCFWCMEPPYEKKKGVIEALSGYIGGHKDNPTYEEVCSGKTGHAEAVQVTYDPAQISYAELLDIFWRNIDPTQVDGQFVDHGNQYRSEIFFHNEEQRKLAEESKKKLAASGRFKKPIVTKITPASKFYPAEEYHQDFYCKNPPRYHGYRQGSGRDAFIEKVWGSNK
ncbi:MAG: Peptide methionine sulfoxide reductase MsrA [Elusimicrobia bacterium]|nr:Peptide methionine sulfoxide reductase MsrA [Elusimicrobiota bacterium]